MERAPAREDRLSVLLMASLPLPARIYIGLVILLGTVLVFGFGPRATFHQPNLFAVLLVLSAVTSAFKVYLPLAKSGSTMSVSYAIDFTALILLGPHETMLVGVASAWSQCTFRMQVRNPAYRTLFSMACLAITVQATGFVYLALGGHPGTFGQTVADVVRPLLGAALTYFVCNTLLIAVAIGLSTRQPILTGWQQNFLWSAPSYFVGAGVAVGAAWALDNSGIWIALLLAAPLYLTYYTYKVYLGRIDDERRHVSEMADLHLATIEALALAIDAKDQTAHAHIRRVQVYAAGLARAFGMSRWKVFRRVWLPQATYRALPTLAGETVLQLKCTPLVATITVVDIYAVASRVRQQTFIVYEPLLLLAVVYLCITGILVFLFRKLEARIPNRLG